MPASKFPCLALRSGKRDLYRPMLGNTLVGKPGSSGEKSLSAAQYSLHTKCYAHWVWGDGRADTGICSCPASSQCLKEDSPHGLHQGLEGIEGQMLHHLPGKVSNFRNA